MPPDRGFPLDDYTPNGYLANPAHTWRMTPSGVVRSVAPVGFGWYFPNHPGPYNHNWLYAAALRVGLAIGGQRLLLAADYRREDVTLIAPYHSSQLFRFEWAWQGIVASATFQRAADDVLGCSLRLLNTGPAVDAQLVVRLDYVRNVDRSLLWEDGVYRRDDAGTPVLGVYPEGTAVALAAPMPPDEQAEVAFDLPGLPPLDADEHIPIPRIAVEARWQVALPSGTAMAFPLALVRQESAEAAVVLADQSLSIVRRGERAAVERDNRFWATSPRLDGDWPEHWRRGIVYDLETLRLCVRPPVGVFRGPWDGMQQQVPRLVLAEAALDALLIGYADPRLGQSLLLTAFRDAPDENLPCCREDGSYNMIAADGQGCGTAPEWCYPLWCVEQLWRRTHDDAFLQAIYPYAQDYVNWWTEYRTDEESWPVYLCSWESGQDCNPRFGRQRTGGDLITHIRPSDLPPALAQSASLLATWAERLDRPKAARRWRRVARRFTALAQRLWNDDWFDDFDTRLGAPSPVRDVMQLAAVFCETTNPIQRHRLAKGFASLPGHGGVWSALEWAPAALTAIESAWLLARPDEVARLAFDLAEHVYRTTDARDQPGNGPLPGVACEHWSRTGGGWGAEGYGWGALPLLATIRWLFGFREEPHGFTLSPSLPDDWLEPGRRYAIGPLPVGLPPIGEAPETLGATGRVDISYSVLSDRGLLTSITVQSAAGRTFTARREAGGRPVARGKRRLQFSMHNLSAVRIDVG